MKHTNNPILPLFYQFITRRHCFIALLLGELLFDIALSSVYRSAMVLVESEAILSFESADFFLPVTRLPSQSGRAEFKAEADAVVGEYVMVAGADKLYVNVIGESETCCTGKLSLELGANDCRGPEAAPAGDSVLVTPKVIVRKPEVIVEEVVSKLKLELGFSILMLESLVVLSDSGIASALAVPCLSALL